MLLLIFYARTTILIDLLSYYGHLSVGVDIPDVDVAFAIARGKDTGMSGTPLSIIDILLSTFEGQYRFKLGVGAPQLDSPIHRT